MNRSIKVSQEVYLDLQRLQRPRETFSQVIERLLSLYDLMGKAEPLVGGAGAYWRERTEKSLAETKVD